MLPNFKSIRFGSSTFVWLLILLMVPSTGFSNHHSEAPSSVEIEAPVQERLGDAMTRVADAILEILDELEREKKVVVGDFIARGRSKSSGGIEINRLLTQCLEDKGVVISDEGEGWTDISGFYIIIPAKDGDDDFESLSLNITVELYDELGERLELSNLEVEGGKENAEVVVPVFGEDVASVGGVSYEVPASATPKEKRKQIVEQYKKPAIKTVGTQVRGTGPYGVEILVKQNGKLSPRTPEFKQGQAFIDLYRGEEYVVKVFNDADFPIAVEMKVDGVGVFVDSMDLKKNSRYVARPGSHATIHGWYIHSGKKEVLGANHQKLPSTKSFLITGYENSVAAREGRKPSDLSTGMISIDIRAAWLKDGPLPVGEPKVVNSRDTTGQGSAVDKKYDKLKNLVFSKHTRSLIHVRYSKKVKARN